MQINDMPKSLNQNLYETQSLVYYTQFSISRGDQKLKQLI